VNCCGSAHITQGIKDVTTMCLGFAKQRTAIIHSSWLDPRKVREMTIVGSKRMIVYDDVAPLEKIRIFDTRVERPPHYDTFGEFQYAYHYGDMYVPYIKQEEPLKGECQHFLDCVRNGTPPLSDGRKGLELVRILEAATRSLEKGGAPVELADERRENRRLDATRVSSGHPEFQVLGPRLDAKNRPTQNGRKLQIRLRVNSQ
jgi:predicted dehydrogenase